MNFLIFRDFFDFIFIFYEFNLIYFELSSLKSFILSCADVTDDMA